MPNIYFFFNRQLEGLFRLLIKFLILPHLSTSGSLITTRHHDKRWKTLNIVMYFFFPLPPSNNGTKGKTWTIKYNISPHIPLGLLYMFCTLFPPAKIVDVPAHTPKDDKLAFSFSSPCDLKSQERRDNDLRLRTVI